MVHPRHRHYRYKNLTVLGLGLLTAFLLSQNAAFHEFVVHLGSLGYLGAFIGGMLFVVSFTAASGLVILLTLSEVMTPWEIALLGGLGAMVGDFTIFRFVKENLLKEIEPIYDQLGGNHLTKVLHTKYFSWTLPVLGAAIIASPLPDEIGVSLLGIARMKTYKFFILAFLLNTIGILLFIVAVVQLRNLTP